MSKLILSNENRSVLWLVFALCTCVFGACDEDPPPYITTDIQGGSEDHQSPNLTIFPDQLTQSTRFIRISSTESPAVVAWSEIEIYGRQINQDNSPQLLSRNCLVTASSFLTAQHPQLAIDGQALSMWNAGTTSPAWIELDLGANFLISSIKLLVAQDRPGKTQHEIHIGEQANALVPVHVFAQYTEHGQWLTLDIDDSTTYPEAGTQTIEAGEVAGEQIMTDLAGEISGEMSGEMSGEIAGGNAVVPEGSVIGKWERIVLPFEYENYAGNPFLLEMNGIFTHQESGQSITLPAYYDGNNTWKIAFMPHLLGQWSWITTSTEAELNELNGSIFATPSSKMGLLAPDTTNPNKWAYQDGGMVIPIGLFVNGMLDDASEQLFTELAEFLGENRFALINFRVSEHDKAFASVNDLSMDIDLWHRLENRVKILDDHGVGVDLMLYTDDSGRPSFSARSEAEKLLIRYLIARLASFPAVLFNTGIDLVEYRDQEWVNWFGQYVKSLDPYDHPVSSRYGGGSGSLVMEEQTFNSVGARNSSISELLTAYQPADLIPALNNDNWSEDLSNNINGHTPDDIRRATWKAIIAGGIGFSIRHNTLFCPRGITECDRYFPIDQAISLLDSEQWIKRALTFLSEQVGERYQQMEPVPNLVNQQGGKYALADPQREQILILLIGQFDSWDQGDGGPVLLDLSQIPETYLGTWFNPRSGELTSVGEYSGSSEHLVVPPSNDDWVLWLQKQ